MVVAQIELLNAVQLISLCDFPANRNQLNLVVFVICVIKYYMVDCMFVVLVIYHFKFCLNQHTIMTDMKLTSVKRYFSNLLTLRIVTSVIL